MLLLLTDCGENEMIDNCFSGVESTCDASTQSFPRPRGACQEKCICQEGYVRSKNGTCKPHDEICPCPINEHHENGYPACQNTCETLVQFCNTSQYTEVPACYCNEGHVRNENNNCIPLYQCPELECPYNEEYVECGSLCPPTCLDPIQQSCPNDCNPGCYCIENHLRAPNGICVPEEICDLTINELEPEYYDDYDESRIIKN